jgi:hypothetical protein
MTVSSVRAIFVVGLLAASASATPRPTLSLLPTSKDPYHQLSYEFLIGKGPLEFTASAPRNSQLVVWATLYHNKGQIDPSYCPYQVHRFTSAASVQIELGFAWAPDPGNRHNAYRIDIAGKAVMKWMANPFYETHAGAEDMGFGSSDASFGIDYVLVQRLYDRKEAGGSGTLDQRLRRHDEAVVIRARFVEPRELPIEFNAKHCAFD